MSSFLNRFDFNVAAIERGIIARLETGDNQTPSVKSRGVRQISCYAGELDTTENFKDVIKKLVPKFPLILVSYGSGADKRLNENLLYADSIEYRHDCGFVVICASNDRRGNETRRHGTAEKIGIYEMIGAITELIGGLAIEVAGEPVCAPLEPSGVEPLMRLTDLSAFALHFSTSFRYRTPDRRAVAVTVEEIEAHINNNSNSAVASNLPGVTAGIIS